VSPETAGAALRVTKMNAWYGQAQALRDVSLNVSTGEIVGILGRNGAGKSTLLRCMARLHRRATGRLELFGDDVLGLTAEKVASRGLSLVREGAAVFESLTVGEHLQLAQALAERRGRQGDMAQVQEWFPVLWERRDVRGGYLSGGQRQMLSLAVAFVSQPRCLLLDEPSAGLAEVVAAALYESIVRIASQDVALIIAEQDGRWLRGLANRAYVLDNGSNQEEKDGSDLGELDVGWTATL
jgi:branched-chain amino acid transport system ATP-binding protein